MEFIKHAETVEAAGLANAAHFILQQFQDVQYAVFSTFEQRVVEALLRTL